RRGGGGGLLATLFLGALFGGTALGREALGLGALGGLALGGLLLLGQALRGQPLLLGLGALALGGELALALGFLFRAQGLLRDAALHGSVGAADAGLEARRRRMAGVGARDQRRQALGLGEVLAVTGLLGGDHEHRHEVGERAGDGGVAGRLLAQRQVVLEGVVARGRVEPAFGVSGTPALAQRVGVQLGQRVGLRGHLFAGVGRGTLGLDGPGARRPVAGRRRLVLAAGR